MRDILKRDAIDIRIVKVSSIVSGEMAENEVRKDFTASERVAIAEAVRTDLGNRKGRPSAENPDRRPDLTGDARDIAAKRSGFGSGKQLERAENVVRLGFIKMMNDVGGQAKKVLLDPKQSELFPKMRRPQMIAVPLYTNGKLSGRKKVEFDDATIAEIQAWRKTKRARQKEKPDQYEKVDEAIDVLLRHTSDTSLTFAEASKLAEEKTRKA